MASEKGHGDSGIVEARLVTVERRRSRCTSERRKREVSHWESMAMRVTSNFETASAQTGKRMFVAVDV